MNLLRRINIEVDSSTWVGTVPQRLSKVGDAGRWRLNIAKALVFTAMWTRPPIYQGMSLADTWAFLRYFPAISDSQILRLRPAWKDIDFHQKTILSDELGVGITTCCLHEWLGFTHYADTLYHLNVTAPTSLSIRFKKKGRFKSPDYVAFDRSKRLHVLECKGTQKSPSDLRKAMRDGVAQKNNLASASTKIHEKLVAGLFIPQDSSSHHACVMVRDPEWDEIEAMLEAVDDKILVAGFTQIVLAKFFALLGFSRTANFLATTPTTELSGIRGSVLHLQSTSDFSLRRSASIEVPINEYRSLSLGEPGTRVLFDVTYSPDQLERLRASSDLLASLLSLGMDLDLQSQTFRKGNGVQVSSSLGFTFRMELTSERS